jgi:hypothetical protein
MMSSSSTVGTIPIGNDCRHSGGRDLVRQRLENVSFIRAAAVPQEDSHRPTGTFRFVDVEQLTESIVNGTQSPHD